MARVSRYSMVMGSVEAMVNDQMVYQNTSRLRG